MEGKASRVLCDAVERHKADILVIGSHGHGIFKRYTRNPNEYSIKVYFLVMEIN